MKKTKYESLQIAKVFVAVNVCFEAANVKAAGNGEGIHWGLCAKRGRRKNKKERGIGRKKEEDEEEEEEEEKKKEINKGEEGRRKHGQKERKKERMNE